MDDTWVPPPRPKLSYSAFRQALIDEQLAKRLTPREVAQSLEAVADHYREITLEECRSLRRLGDDWLTDEQRKLKERVGWVAPDRRGVVRHAPPLEEQIPTDSEQPKA